MGNKEFWHKNVLKAREMLINDYDPDAIMRASKGLDKLFPDGLSDYIAPLAAAEVLGMIRVHDEAVNELRAVKWAA